MIIQNLCIWLKIQSEAAYHCAWVNNHWIYHVLWCFTMISRACSTILESKDTEHRRLLEDLWLINFSGINDFSLHSYLIDLSDKWRSTIKMEYWWHKWGQSEPEKARNLNPNVNIQTANWFKQARVKKFWEQHSFRRIAWSL